MRRNPLVMTTRRRWSSRTGSMLVFFLFTVLVALGIASLSALVMQHATTSRQRLEMMSAYQFAEGGAALACTEIETAYLNTKGDLLTNLETNPSGAYAKNGTLSNLSRLVYDRTITGPFTDQSVRVQLFTNSIKAGNINKVMVVSTAQVGHATQTVQSYLDLQFSLVGAVLISDSPGSKVASCSKGNAKSGNICVSGNPNGILAVDGNMLANGGINTANYTNLGGGVSSKYNYGTANEVPDYTDPGASDQLFDFRRFIAVADASGNHFKTLAAFIAEANKGILEGIVVVDISKKQKLPNLSKSTLPRGIRVNGCLVFNFDSTWDEDEKIINTADMYINPADLSKLDPLDTTTYKSGYPPTYQDIRKDPANVDISASGYANFTKADDLPALMYSNGILDMHGNVNISGVLYTPSFVELENKGNGQIQYIRGAIIGGNGIWVENHQQKSTTVVSYDLNTLDLLATSGTKAKTMKVVYRK